MNPFRPSASRSFRQFGLAAGLLLAFILATACGSEGDPADKGEEGFQKITASDRILTIDDLKAIGYKTSKQYEVEGLPSAVDAWLGFWGPDPYSRKDYELRFYASHADAVEHGVPLADEATGEKAWDYKDNPTWEQGAKDRWQLERVGMGAVGAHVASGPSPKYADFAVFGNIAMLCEGADSSQSLERCEGLVNALSGDGGQ